MATVTFALSLPASFHRDGDLYIGCFPHLDVMSQGRTQQEAEQNLIEAAQLFIESCYQRNVLDEVLKSCGFQPGVGPHVDADQRDHLTVPFELLARNGAPAHAC